jgi:glycosyltransferase involved in cell wall biosynthesis
VLEAAARAGVAMVSVGGAPSTTPDETSQHVPLGRVPDTQLKWLYAHAEALVSASREDFGLTPLEANLEGTPALVAEAGGFLDSVVPGVNGAFFEPESVDACAVALSSFRKGDYDSASCRTHAEENFSLERHLSALREALETAAEGARHREGGAPAASHPHGGTGD